MNILRPLSPHLPRIRKFLYSLLIVVSLLSIFYSAILLLGVDPTFLLGKIKGMLLRRSFHFLFSRLGWGLFFLIIYAALDPETGGHMMAPSGANCEKEGSTSSSANFTQYLNLSSENEGDSAPEPSTASGRDKFIIPSPAISQSELLGAPNPGEEGNSQPSQGVGQRLPGSPLEISSPGISGESLFRDSVEQPGGGPAPSEAAPPANPAGSQEAGPSNQGPAPYPYQPDQVIGGDSVRAIQRRLLAKHEGNFTYEVCYFTRIEAEDLFEVKAKILGEMSRLDPEGPWLERGARALDNPRTSTGEESLGRLSAILDELREGGRQSGAFARLTTKL